MNTDSLKQTVRPFLAENKIIESFELLNEFILSPKIRGELAFLEAEYRTVSRQFQLNLLSSKKRMLHIKQTIDSLNNLLMQIQDQDLFTMEEPRIFDNLLSENTLLKQKVRQLETEVRTVRRDIKASKHDILIGLVDYWLEILIDHAPPNGDNFPLQGRPFSIAHFIFNDLKGDFELNGINYTTEGEEFYAWNTIKSISEFDRRRFYYFYSVNKVYGQHSDDYGLGMIHFHYDGRIWSIRSGFFSDFVENKSATQMKIMRLSEVARMVNFHEDIGDRKNHRELIRLLSEKWAEIKIKIA